MQLRIISVVLNYVFHCCIVLAEQTQQVVADEKIVAWRYCLQSEFRTLRIAFVVNKESVSGVRAPGIQPL